MKSPMIQSANYIEDKENFSDLRVCRSAAGYYIGTVYHHPEGFDTPGSRDSGYFKIREEAEAELELVKSDTIAASMLRREC